MPYISCALLIYVFSQNHNVEMYSLPDEEWPQLFKKKIRGYSHVPLWGVYKPDPKAFFVWTSLEGPTTW